MQEAKTEPEAHVCWHRLTIREALTELAVDSTERGLSEHEATQRLERHGPNQLRQAETRSALRVLVDQLRSFVVYILGAAAVAAFATQRLTEGLAVLTVIVVNTTIGFVSEWKAMRSMAALRELGEHRVRVRRDGKTREVPAHALVPGDLVLLSEGDLVPADLRLVEAERLRASEAPLTGEPVPTDKSVDPVDADTELAERADMVFSGTSVAAGHGVGVVVATGMQSELGRVSELAQQENHRQTPLQVGLDQLGRRLAWITVGIAAVVAGVGLLLRHQDPTLIVETALALGVAAIPEGLPIVATIALARGMFILSRRNALVNRLSAVETLGATRVIFSDKTGTLTENRMRLTRLVTPETDHELPRSDADPERLPLAEQPSLTQRALEVAVLCNTARLDTEESAGDPTEVALLEGARAMGLDPGGFREEHPAERTEEFDPRVRKMATFHADDGGGYRVAVKGAPSAVLEVCREVAASDGQAGTPMDEAARKRWRERSEALAREGSRVLALAEKHVSGCDGEPYSELSFLGLVGLLDPARAGARDAVDQCQAAGIRVAMITGDQAPTAQAIAESVGIVGGPGDPEAVVLRGRELRPLAELDEEDRERIYRANIFARMSPEQKLDLVDLFQSRGDVVAMTGDGINDAPALKKADIGVAMGLRGTDAAKQVADMVLRDDRLETIVSAVEHGRVIFQNIRASVMFMLCTNLAEVLVVSVATFAGWTLPLRPLQILYLNMLTDVLPALALGASPASGQEMGEPPRASGEGVLTAGHWWRIGGWASVLAASVLGALLLAERRLGLAEESAVSVSFLTLAFAKLWFVFNLRRPRSGWFSNEITRNPWMWGALLSCAVLLLAAVYVPVLARVLDLAEIGKDGWLLVLAMSGLPLAVGQVALAVGARRRRK